MFCTTLRNRSIWASSASTLSRSETPQYKEKTLTTHDIALPMPGAASKTDFFRLLCLSSADFITSMVSATNIRIDRLATLSGGQNIAILFLFQESSNSVEGMQVFLELQAYLIEQDLAIPILPLASIASLEKSLLEFSLVFAQQHPVSELPNPATDILPFCSTTPPLSEHTRSRIVALIPNLKSLVTAATDRDGRTAIREAIGLGHHKEAEDVINFWKTEFVYE